MSVLFPVLCCRFCPNVSVVCFVPMSLCQCCPWMSVCCLFINFYSVLSLYHYYLSCSLSLLPSCPGIPVVCLVPLPFSGLYLFRASFFFRDSNFFGTLHFSGIYLFQDSTFGTSTLRESTSQESTFRISTIISIV